MTSIQCVCTVAASDSRAEKKASVAWPHTRSGRPRAHRHKTGSKITKRRSLPTCDILAHTHETRGSDLFRSHVCSSLLSPPLLLFLSSTSSPMSPSPSLSLRNGQKECSLSQAFQQSTRLPDALPGRNRLDVGRLDGGRDERWREWWCWGGGGGDHSGIMRLWLGYLWEHAQVRNQKMQSSRNKCYTQNRDCHLKK